MLENSKGHGFLILVCLPSFDLLRTIQAVVNYYYSQRDIASMAGVARTRVGRRSLISKVDGR